MSELATEKNKEPLPPLPASTALVLPPNHLTLTNPNYQIPTKRKEEKEDEKGPRKQKKKEKSSQSKTESSDPMIVETSNDDSLTSRATGQPKSTQPKVAFNWDEMKKS